MSGKLKEEVNITEPRILPKARCINRRTGFIYIGEVVGFYEKTILELKIGSRIYPLYKADYVVKEYIPGEYLFCDGIIPVTNKRCVWRGNEDMLKNERCPKCGGKRFTDLFAIENIIM